MSHIATIELVVKDLVALRAACETLGLELCENRTRYHWYGRAVGRPADATDGVCEHAIRVKDNGRAYEIGLVSKADGTGYELKWDSYMGGFGLVEKVGENAGRLRQEYAIEIATRVAKRQGFRIISKTIRSDGSVALVTQKG